MADVTGSRRLIRRIFARHRRDVAAGAACWSTHQVCEALVPVAIGLVIDQAVAPGDGRAMVWSVLGVFGLFLVLTMAWRAGMWFLSRAVIEESHGLRLDAVRRIITGRGIETERRTGELLSIATSDTLAAAEILETVSRAAAATVGLAVSAVVLIRIDWSLGLGVLVGIPVLVLGLNALGPRVERQTSAQQESIGLAAATASDLLQGLRPLRGFGGVSEASSRYRRTSRTSLGATVGAVRARSTFLGVSTFVTGALVAVVAAVAGWYALRGQLSIGELITVIGLAAFLSDPVLNLAECVVLLAGSRASATRVAELLDAPVRAGTGGDRPVVGELRFDDVHTAELSGVTFATGPGELVGVVTTELAAADAVTALLAGERTPETGTVRLADRSLVGLDLAELRRVLLVEPHEVDFFGSTLREALRTTGTEVSGGPAEEDAMARALAAAAATELATGPAGLDRELLDRGRNLSGGQRQRVAVARALLAAPPLLAFRDPTTAVDAVTEHAMADGIRALRSTPAYGTVLVTTSAPLLDRCDRVVFLREGRVAAEGRHHDLLAEPAYAEVVLR